jgi:hypothetical protein
MSAAISIANVRKLSAISQPSVRYTSFRIFCVTRAFATDVVCSSPSCARFTEVATLVLRTEQPRLWFSYGG